MKARMTGALRPLALVLLLASLPAAVHAEEASSAESVSIWRLATYKTITFEAAANTADIALFAMLIGGSAATAASFFAINTATAATAYYSHEIAWSVYGPELDAESETRIALEKTVTYRLVSIVRNLALGSAFGGGFTASVAFTVAGQVVDTALYLTNETLWAWYGPRPVR